MPYFEKVVREPEQQVTLRGQSKSTLQNYIQRIASCVVHVRKLPEQIDSEEINEYLVSLIPGPKVPLVEKLLVLQNKSIIPHATDREPQGLIAVRSKNIAEVVVYAPVHCENGTELRSTPPVTVASNGSLCQNSFSPINITT